MQSDWKTSALGEVAVFEMGQAPSSQFVSTTGQGYPFLQGNGEFGIRFPSPKLICSRPNKVSRPHDLLVSVRAPVGELNIADQAYAIGRGLAAIRFLGVVPEFGWHAVNFAAPDLNKVAQGSTFSAVGKSELRALTIPLPPLPEQRRIAEILDTLDRTIESTQRIIEKLQATRQGLLHDLLTRGLDEHGQLRDPERNPELFKETELGLLPRAWEATVLNECILLESGQHIAAEFCNTDSLGWPYFTGPADFYKKTTIVTRYTTHPKVLCQRGDILITVKGSGCGKAAIASTDACISRQLMALKSDVRDSSFWMIFFEKNEAYLNEIAAGSAIPGLSRGQILSLPVPLPPSKERAAIGLVVENFDNRLSVEQTRLAKLQALKRGLMDDLLTGRVRVPVTAGEAVPPPAAPAPVAQQDAPSTIPFDRAPLAPVVNFRAAPGASSVAQADWVAQARTLASRQQPAPYSPEALDRAVAQLAGLSVDPEGILQVPDVLRQAGVRFVLLQHPKGSKTSGAAFWLDDACRAEPVVALSMRYPLVDVFWFNLFHELGHIRHGHAAVLGEVLEPGTYRGDDAAEREANAYAREALIPDAVWQPYLESGNHSSRGLRAFARQIGRHHATVAGRLGHDLRDFPRFNSRELRPSVPTEVFERLVLRLGGSV